MNRTKTLTKFIYIYLFIYSIVDIWGVSNRIYLSSSLTRATLRVYGSATFTKSASYKLNRLNWQRRSDTWYNQEFAEFSDQTVNDIGIVPGRKNKTIELINRLIYVKAVKITILVFHLYEKVLLFVSRLYQCDKESIFSST